MKLSESRFLVVSSIVVLLMLISVGGLVRAEEPEHVIRITAKKFEYAPHEITLKKGVPVVLEFTSLDRLHGFNCRELRVRADIYPNKVAKVQVIPQQVGTFDFFCDNFCGSGHSEMRGKFIVTE